MLIFLIPQNGYSQITFVEKALQLGINHTYIAGQSAGGISFVDFNGDGLDDISLATAKGDLIHFYRNIGSGFVRNAPLIANNSEQKQIFWVDYDNDGDKDLFVCAKGDINRLYQNNGNLQLTDITSSSNLPLHSFDTFNACWADFNRDGWLDLYVCERIGEDQSLNRNYLFFNNADGTFTDVSETSNILVPGKLPFCSSALDFNKDKWPDIYIANDRGWGNIMLQNIGHGIFEDVSEKTNTDFFIDGMSIALGDYNNDAYTDIYVTNIPNGNLLLRNNRDTLNNIVYSDEAATTGTGFYGTAWGANFLDADNDMHADLYVSGSDIGEGEISSAFYKNEANDSFSLITKGFEGDTVISYANAIGDYNNDGYPEIMVMNFNGSKSFFYKNETVGNNYIKLKLQGIKSNRDGVGCSIDIFTDSIHQYYYTHSGVGFLAQNSENYCFGIGKNEIIDSIIVSWPTGHIDILRDISINQQILIIEGSTNNGIINIDEGIEIRESDFPSAIIEFPLEVEVNVSPNPFTNTLNINSTSLIKTITLLDSRGRKINSWTYNRNINHANLKIAEPLTDGHYILVISHNDGLIVTKPLIKAN